MKKLTCLLFAVFFGAASGLHAQFRLIKKTYSGPDAGAIASLYDQGKYKEAAAAADQLRKQHGEASAKETYTFSRAYAQAGEKDKALACLNEAIDKGFWRVNNIKEDAVLRKALDGPALDGALERARAKAQPYLKGIAPITQADKEKIVAMVRKGLKNTYFDTAVAREMSYELKRMLDGGFFNAIDTSAVFLREITNYLRAKTNDKHFYVGIDRNALAERVPNESVTTPAERNYGFREVTVKAGNIGYIRWEECIAGPEAYKTAQSALNFLRNTRAIVIDISRNGGGSGNISTFLYHYLFAQDDKRFETLLIKKCRGEAEWHRSEPTVAPLPGGPSLGDKPVYVVTSGRTFSAAEYFAFIMKELGRATIIGENTGGGGNPVSLMTEDNYVFYIPVCQIKTTENKSLEGKGVAPDIILTTNDWQQEMLEKVTADLKSKGK